MYDPFPMGPPKRDPNFNPNSRMKHDDYFENYQKMSDDQFKQWLGHLKEAGRMTDMDMAIFAKEMSLR